MDCQAIQVKCDSIIDIFYLPYFRESLNGGTHSPTHGSALPQVL
ncbi:MAG: hypothetical protein WCI71_14265 [Bacteroidota bacterium]